MELNERKKENKNNNNKKNDDWKSCVEIACVVQNDVVCLFCLWQWLTLSLQVRSDGHGPVVDDGEYDRGDELGLHDWSRVRTLFTTKKQKTCLFCACWDDLEVENYSLTWW